MTFLFMIVLCAGWGCWCADNDVPVVVMIIVAGLIGLVSFFIESRTGA